MITDQLTSENARERLEEAVAALRRYPGRFRGRGIVICGGGLKYFPCVWVCVNMLRRMGCSLPIQNWHLGSREMTEPMKARLASLGVECVDAYKIRRRHPARILNGWEVKPYAMLHCPFEEVLLLDADNVAVVNPEFLFETAPYRENGAIFWPDYGRLAATRLIWELCGVSYRDEPEFESGQIVVNKRKCWKALNLTMWFNEHSDFFYQHIHGDKETFHMAWRKLDQPYAMPEKGIHPLSMTMCQHDFEGRRIFQHRNLEKWSILWEGSSIPGFWYEAECREYLRDLGDVLRCYTFDVASQPESVQRLAETLIGKSFLYRRVGHDERKLEFRANGTIGVGSARHERLWGIVGEDGEWRLVIASEKFLTCRLKLGARGVWTGRWMRHEQMPVELIPCAD